VQKDKLRDLANRVKTVELSFLPLHFGFRRNQILGPSNVKKFLEDIQHKAPDDVKVILFNTGLHDIHQLCGADKASDRRDYLDKAKLDSGSFFCVDEYKSLLKEFIEIIRDYPAELKVFQSTTGAWPKYGNWGVGWEHYPQGMPLVSDFCSVFNDIAFDLLAGYKKDGIHIMDGYWITYARPDNREVGTTGNKLSHPGQEVLSVMARSWAKIILDKVCFE
jgi:hypothetical protein